MEKRTAVAAEPLDCFDHHEYWTSWPNCVRCRIEECFVGPGMPEVYPRKGDLRYVAANDEHGILEIINGGSQGLLGDSVLLVLGHCDPTVNLYRQIVGFRNGKVECLWNIEARGLSQ